MNKLMLGLTLLALSSCNTQRQTILVFCPTYFEGVVEVDDTKRENSSPMSTVYALPDPNGDGVVLISRTMCVASVK